MRWNRFDTRVIGMLLLLLVTAPVAGSAGDGQGDDDAGQGTRIRIEREVAEGEEGEGRHHMVFIDEDGVVEELEGEGSGFAWIDGPHGRHHGPFGEGFWSGKGGFLGVSTTDLTRELRAHFGAPEDAGVMVSRVAEDSAAFTAGLAVGDIITAVDGERVGSPMELLRAIRGHDEGDAVSLEIYRDGRVEALSAVLGRTEGPAFAFRGAPPFGRKGHFGPRLRVHCEEEGDCDVFLRRRLEVCGDDEACDVDIRCADGSCECEVNGAATDCEGLHSDDWSEDND